METPNLPSEGSVEYFIRLGFTKREAKSLAKSWAFRIPTDQAEAMKVVRQGVQDERKGRDIITDRRLAQEKRESKA